MNLPIKSRRSSARFLTVGLHLGLAALVSLASTGIAAAQSSPAYQQVNILSDGSVQAQHTDPALINPWGIAIGQQTPFWVNDAGSGESEVLNPDGTEQFNVMVPASGTSAAHGRPTGIVFNGSATAFPLPNSNGPSTFVFATLDGTLAAWSAKLSNAVTVVDNSGSHSVYTGLTIGARGAEPILLAANTSLNRIDAFDSNFQPTTLAGNFTDPNLPAGYVPYGIRSVGSMIIVTYVQAPPAPGPPVTGSGLGYVDAFDGSGNFKVRVASAGPLNAPWGIALAPATFGGFGGDLLIGNFGDGVINAFDAQSFTLKGQIQDASGKPLANSGLWDLVFGQAGVGDPNTLYLSAGINGEKGGLFASITPATAAAADFSISLPTATVSVVAGQSASMQVNLTASGGFSGPVSFACSGLPISAICSFSPNPVTLNGASASTNMTVLTHTGSGPYVAEQTRRPISGRGLTPLLGIGVLPLLGIGALRRRGLGNGQRMSLLMMLAAALALGTIAGCGYSKPGSTMPTPGASPVSVTATSGGITHTAQFTLHLQ